MANCCQIPSALKLSNTYQVPSTWNNFVAYLEVCVIITISVRTFSSIARPLYALLKLDARWNWTTVHSHAVSTILNNIPNGSITCYDQSKPLFVTSDASKDGLGFVLSHDPELKEIIWTGSRVLTPAESNYSNIECEALSLMEAVKYFHRFVAGRHFTIRTDHAPLRFIFNSSAHSERVSCRLQRLGNHIKSLRLYYSIR